MKIRIKTVLCTAVCLGLMTCASPGGGNLNLSRGQQIPAEFVSIQEFSAASVTIHIRVRFTQESLYHIITDEAGHYISEGWFRTSRDGTGKYTVTMKAKGRLSFETGKRYLLCIGTQHPDQVRLRTNNYPCMANAWFILKD